ncbi:MAG TPA: hypothetical protein VFH03_13335 [Actinoplanes sp.]|nr:hypothetical protein [Actinoplanes sp.]
MTTTVIHQPRVAWDGACAFVRVAATPAYPVFAYSVRSVLGPEIHAQLEETHERVFTNLVWNDGDRYVTDVEAGKWRVRLEDLLRNRPDLVGPLIDLTAMVPR